MHTVCADTVQRESGKINASKPYFFALFREEQMFVHIITAFLVIDHMPEKKLMKFLHIMKMKHLVYA